ncbi:MAG: glycosyltransferase family 77 protein [Alkalinema sp. RL_2_19]|nr:glycosyltransferase family 77 protein [Alkalinema sp. RL_2_19]
MQFNSGLILWRNTPTTSQLFEQWHQEWQKFRCQDQLALVRAIHQTQPPIVKLPSIYNMSPIDAASSGANVHLLHHWGGWSQQENSADRPRHVIPN